MFRGRRIVLLYAFNAHASSPPRRLFGDHLLFAVFAYLLKPIQFAREIMDRPRRAYLVVDMLKGISVLMVILYHIVGGVALLYKEFPERIVAFVASVPPVMDLSFTADKAVDIFFLLSSFLLSMALFKSVERTGGIEIRRFYLHRFFRLYPLFLVALLFYGLPRFEFLARWGWLSLLFVDNVFAKSIIPVGWSLSVEVQFYLFLPFIILFVAKCRRPLLWLSLITLFTVALRAQVVLANPITYRTPWHIFISQANVDDFFQAIHFRTRSRVTPLVLGVIWAYLARRYPPGSIRIPRIPALLAGLAAGAVVYLTMLYPVARASSIYYVHYSETVNLFLMITHRLFFSLGVMVIGLLLQYRSVGERPGWLDRFIEWRPWRLLSEVAYPMYLFHLPLVIVAAVIVIHDFDIEGLTEFKLYWIPLVFIVATALTLYVSLWLNHWIEAPWMRRGKVWEERLFGPRTRP